MTVSEGTFEKIAILVGDKKTPMARPSTHAEKLKLYGLYKQATVSDSANQRPKRPGMFNIDGRMRWDAWAACDDMSQEDARQAYAGLAKELIGKPVEDVLASE
eukprot:CAMPEP_0201684918 /NCGR_PEP_ID=MMETSP0494-20130426/52890_1 /ASSEMBLY_ACC=CAM_ASM_000839 /TAXON_ID=420259 /ORGANISM="Thalassiosira gravida, Strain GMp14c1" /LENGTH=102 /DNA_ID=CAMNT_0048168741 /DNA_START=13 /DNA_END=321 /DNA_ORIENTATION=-